MSRQGAGAAALVLPFRQAVELPNGGITLVGAIEEIPAVAAAHEIFPSELPRPDETDTTNGPTRILSASGGWSRMSAVRNQH